MTLTRTVSLTNLSRTFAKSSSRVLNHDLDPCQDLLCPIGKTEGRLKGSQGYRANHSFPLACPIQRLRISGESGEERGRNGPVRHAECVRVRRPLLRDPRHEPHGTADNRVPAAARQDSPLNVRPCQEACLVVRRGGRRHFDRERATTVALPARFNVRNSSNRVHSRRNTSVSLSLPFWRIRAYCHTRVIPIQQIELSAFPVCIGSVIFSSNRTHRRDFQS